MSKRESHPGYEANKERLAERQRAYYEANKGWTLDDIAAAAQKPSWLVQEWSTGGAPAFPKPIIDGMWQPDEVRSWCASKGVAVAEPARDREGVSV